MIAKCFKIECLTNLHVGNGDVNYNIIDNEVERDSVTNYPTINSSGLKGALREHFNAKGCEFIRDVFGDEGDMSQGKIKFLSANMLARPMRVSDGDSPYFLVTTKKAVELLNKLVSEFGLNFDKISLSLNGKAEIEGIECSLTDSLNPLGLDVAAVMEDKEFSNMPLPVVARNKLESGKSVNLWYEEIVPHESVFTFFIIANDDSKDLVCKLTEEIKKEPIQFGGNATVGYGLCKVTEIGG